jgi:site-specific recombinase XerD
MPHYGVILTKILYYPNVNEGRLSSASKRNFLSHQPPKALGLNDGATDRRQRVVFHALQRPFGSWLAIRGAPLYIIGSLMGHSTLEMTKRYAHLCPDAKLHRRYGFEAMISLDLTLLPGKP